MSLRFPIGSHLCLRQARAFPTTHTPQATGSLLTSTLPALTPLPSFLRCFLRILKGPTPPSPPSHKTTTTTKHNGPTDPKINRKKTNKQTPHCHLSAGAPLTPLLHSLRLAGSLSIPFWSPLCPTRQAGPRPPPPSHPSPLHPPFLPSFLSFFKGPSPPSAPSQKLSSLEAVSCSSTGSLTSLPPRLPASLSNPFRSPLCPTHARQPPPRRPAGPRPPPPSQRSPLHPPPFLTSFLWLLKGPSPTLRPFAKNSIPAGLPVS